MHAIVLVPLFGRLSHPRARHPLPAYPMQDPRLTSRSAPLVAHVSIIFSLVTQMSSLNSRDSAAACSRDSPCFSKRLNCERGRRWWWSWVVVVVVGGHGVWGGERV